MQREKSRFVAVMLSFFLGGIGVQKLYLNRPRAFWLSLIFCWTFIPAFIAIYDMVRFSFMSDSKFAAYYSH